MEAEPQQEASLQEQVDHLFAESDKLVFEALSKFVELIRNEENGTFS